MPYRLYFSLLVVCCAAGCTKPKPTERHFRFDFGTDSGLTDDMQVFLGDEKISRVNRPKPSSSDTKGAPATIGITLPVDQLLHERVGELTVHFNTPCGPRTLGVKAPDLEEAETKARRKERYDVDVKAELDGEVPPFAMFWVDQRKGKRQVTVGKAKLEPPVDTGAPLFDLGCAPEHVVSVDGKPYGKVSTEGLVFVEGMDERMAKDLERERRWADMSRERYAKRRTYPLPSAHILIGAPNTCYRDGFVVYKQMGDTSGGGSSKILQGRPLHQLKSAPSYFMREAPGSARTASNTTELVPVDCKTKKVLH